MKNWLLLPFECEELENCTSFISNVKICSWYFAFNRYKCTHLPGVLGLQRGTEPWTLEEDTEPEKYQWYNLQATRTLDIITLTGTNFNFISGSQSWIVFSTSGFFFIWRQDVQFFTLDYESGMPRNQKSKVNLLTLIDNIPKIKSWTLL